MVTRACRFTTLILASLNTGMAFCHALELPAKMRHDYARYRIDQTLYAAFGPTGAFIEPGSILSAALLSFLVRRRRPAFKWTVAGTGFLAASLAAWFTFVAPMNTKMAQWSPEAEPPDWTRVRNQWEYAHAGRFILQLVGLSLLVVSVLVDRPTDQSIAEQPVTARFARVLQKL